VIDEVDTMQKVRGDTVGKVVFVRNTAGLARATRGSTRSSHFLTSDIAVFRELAKRGQEVSGTWDYLDDESRPRLLLEATNLKDAWYEGLRSCFSYRGLNMGDAIKFPVYHFLLEALTAAKISESLFTAKRPSVLRISALSGIPVKYGLAQRSDVAEAVLAQAASQLGVSIEWVGRGGTQMKAGVRAFLRRSVPAPIRRIRREAVGWLAAHRESEAHEFVGLAEAIASLRGKQTRYTAVGASAYQSLLMFIGVAAHLESKGDWSTLLVHTGHDLGYDSMLRDARALDFIDPNQSRSFKYLEIFKASKQQTKRHQRFIRQLWQGFLEWQRNYQGPHREVFCNPYLKFQYKYLLIDLMEELCRVVDAARDIFEQTQPDVLLIGNVSEKDLTVASVARQMQVRSVLVPHNLGWASPEDYEYPVDYIAVQNEGIARFLKGIVGSRQLLVVGNLKPKKSGLPEEIKPHTQPSGTAHTRILVLTGGFTPGVFQNCNPGAFYSSVEALVAYLDKRTDWKVIFRTHPRLESSKWIKDLVQHTQAFISGQLTLQTTAVAEEIIPKVDLVLMLDYRSSPAIAAWKHGVPIIRWASSTLLYSVNDMFREDWFPQVTNCSELEQMIARFISDEEWRNQWISKGHELGNEYFSAPELPETILADMLTNLCQENSAYAKTGAGDHAGH
jgi:hypothetical protein